ncbi:MAG: AMP-binding protein [Geminicoccaceae bacterium]
MAGSAPSNRPNPPEPRRLRPRRRSLHHRSIERVDLSSLDFCISGEAPLPAGGEVGFEERTGSVVVEGYGLSEASRSSPAIRLMARSWRFHPGLPMPGTAVSLRDPEQPAHEVAEGELGEICVRGPTIMQGYWRRPEETANVFVDGWLRTGDIGRRDGDGYLHLVDRIKDLIIVNGYNVYPRSIEDAFYSHPVVAEVTVIGIPDSASGEVPKAFVRLRDGETVSADDLRTHLVDRLSPLEMPRSIEFRDELPKSMIGKLSKKELVAEERDRREQAATAE